MNMRFGKISDPRRTDSKRLLILFSRRLLGLSLRIEMADPVRSANVIQMVAHRFEHDTDQTLKQLLLSLTCRGEVLESVGY
jgi:hypothetical protein